MAKVYAVMQGGNLVGIFETEITVKEIELNRLGDIELKVKKRQQKAPGVLPADGSKRGRGRPRKIVEALPEQTPAPVAPLETLSVEPEEKITPVKKGKGKKK
jgi:hypothetical protein